MPRILPFGSGSSVGTDLGDLQDALQDEATVRFNADNALQAEIDALIISLTQAEYDAITPNASTLYVIV
jgi:hypothetical protein